MISCQSMDEMVSVIVPVYNVEKYLSQCVKSILSQTYKNFELLLIDDGSTDNSGIICDKFAGQDGRITVFHRENAGVSAARNYGLGKAKGSYVLFVDSDDMIAPDLLECALYVFSQTQSDIVEYQYSSIDEYGEAHPYSGKLNDFQKTMSLTVDEALCLLFEDRIQSYSWSFIAKRKLYEVPDAVRFPNEKMFEDTGTIYKIFAHAEQITILNKKLYCYRQRAESAMHTSDRLRISKALSSASIARFEYFIQLGQALKNSYAGNTYKILLLRSLEEQVACYYGILEEVSTANNIALSLVNRRIDIVMREIENRSLIVPIRVLLRIYAIKLHMPKVLVLLEKILKNMHK